MLFNLIVFTKARLEFLDFYYTTRTTRFFSFMLVNSVCISLNQYMQGKWNILISNGDVGVKFIYNITPCVINQLNISVHDVM